jgi:hypothetical protein
VRLEKLLVPEYLRAEQRYFGFYFHVPAMDLHQKFKFVDTSHEKKS